MKRVYISQRVDIVAEYGERRDALDQRWSAFLRETGVIPFPLSNDIGSVAAILETAPPDGILLTGGNSPVQYGGNSPERDESDAFLLAYATKHKTPLIGVCRGMQSVLLYFEGSLREIDSHIAVRHAINGRITRTVNSYHSLVPEKISPCLMVLAHSEDGAVEAVRHGSLPILAVMWHPEREETFASDDVELFRKVWFGKADTI